MRWVSFSRVSMQRVGVLLAVTAAASESRATTLEGISRSYADLLRRLLPVPAEREERVLRYIAEQRLWKRYPELHDGQEPRRHDKTARVEFQDICLADPDVPSPTGAITNEVVDEPPQLAASLLLIRDKNYTLTDRGRALERAARPAITALRNGELDPNPFLLTPGSRALILYALLDADADFVRAIYRVVLRELGPEFTRPTFGERLPDACRALRSEWIPKARTAALQGKLARLEKLAALIDRPVKEQRTWGGGRPRDQTGTLRIEPYVDLGLVTRPSRSKYDYRLSPGQRRFFENLIGAEDADSFLDEALFRSFLESQNDLKEPKRLNSDDVWARIRDAYTEMKSGLGYESFREVVLLAIARLVDEDEGMYFEVGDGIRAIRARQKADPKAVRFGVARGGALTYMKIMDERARR
jgi:hypothetical protein